MKAQMTEKDEVFKNYKLNFFINQRLKNYRRSIVTTNTSEKKK